MAKMDDFDFEYSMLTAISPIDGRYRSFVKELVPYVTEYALIYYRVLVEVPSLFSLIVSLPFLIFLVLFMRKYKIFICSFIFFFFFLKKKKFNRKEEKNREKKKQCCWNIVD